MMHVHDKPVGDFERGVVVVLCADPDASVRITYWLREALHTVLPVYAGSHAADILKKLRVEAVVTDRLLPPWPGLDAFALLRNEFERLAIIYVGDGNYGHSSLARAAGATHVLPFPLRRQALLDALPRGVATA